MAAGLSVAAPTAPSVAVEPGADPFYTYSGTKPLADYKPGDILATRTVPYSLAGLPLPLSAVQLLYRSVDQLGRPIANVTSVVPPLAPVGNGVGKMVSYQSFYDSLNPADGPSRSIAGGVSVGGFIANAETLVILPLLLQGYTINIPDTEGPDADFAAGPEYGVLTLDSIRAASGAAGTGTKADAPVGLIGYSGGAIATNWAASLAAKYAPDVNKRLVGAAEGGVLVAPANNLDYISGAPIWGGVTGMAIIGAARAFDIDLDPYLNEDGKAVLEKMKNASIANVLGQYPGFTFERYVKPQFANPRTVAPFVKAVNILNMGSAPSPTIPMLIHQGAGGFTEQTPGNKPGIGPGDGVMIAGDVRSLARKYCADGTPVDYTEHASLSHIGVMPVWAPAALSFLNARFAGTPATNNCATIAPGNSLAPWKLIGGPDTPGVEKTVLKVSKVGVLLDGKKQRTGFTVVVRSTGVGTLGKRVGRTVVKLDGKVVKSFKTPVEGSGRTIKGQRREFRTHLNKGTHVLRVRFTPTNPKLYKVSDSGRITFRVKKSAAR